MTTYDIHSSVAAAALAGIEVGSREAANKETRRIIEWLREEAKLLEIQADRTTKIGYLIGMGTLYRVADKLEQQLREREAKS